MNPRAYQLVRDKRAWQEPPEPADVSLGFKGWTTRGYLPHFDKPGTLQMLTFRLHDAMPASRQREWEELLAIESQRDQRTKIEAYLDKGHGSCVLRNPRAAAAVEEVLLHSDGRHYRLAAWVVMPNHVHVLVELWDLPLGPLLRAWKGASANAVNKLLARNGTLWQREYWDRYVRDEDHFRKAQHYIEWNAVKAGLVKTPPDWPFGSANPKWRWTGADRYRSVHLVRDGAPPSATPLRPTEQASLRSNTE
jgi:putative transposase